MHICFVTTPYPVETHLGGTGTYAHTAARILAKRGHRVSVISVTWKGPSSRVMDEGVEVLRFYEKHRNTVRDDLRRNWEVLKAVNELKPDIVQAAEYEAEGFMLARQPRRRYKLVTRLTCHFTLTNVRKQYPFLLQRSTRHYMALQQAQGSDVLLSPSLYLARQIEHDSGFKPGSIRQIYNSIDLEEMRAFREAIPELQIDGPYMIYFGRLEVLSKGILDLVEALPAVWKKFPNIKMVFAGLHEIYQYEHQPIAHYIKRVLSDYASNIIITGHIPRSKLMPLVARARLAVLPSRREPFGFSCVEALGLGVPLVTTGDSGGPAEIVAGKNDPDADPDTFPAGWLVPRHNPPILADTIIEALSDRAAYMLVKHNTLRRASRFNAELMVDKLESLYSELVN